MANKQDDFQPFPVKEQLSGVDYCINSPPRWGDFLLSLSQSLLRFFSLDKSLRRMLLFFSGAAEAILLGFQHYVASLGTVVFIASVLVPQMGGGRVSCLQKSELFLLTEMKIKFSVQDEKARVIQTMVFVAGINTLIQVNFGTRLPVVISSSRTFLLPTLSIIFCKRYGDVISPQEVPLIFFLSLALLILNNPSLIPDCHIFRGLGTR